MSPRHEVVPLKRMCLLVLSDCLEEYARCHILSCEVEGRWHVDPDYPLFCPELKRARDKWQRLLPVSLREDLLSVVSSARRKRWMAVAGSVATTDCCRCVSFLLLYGEGIKIVHIQDLNNHASRYFSFLGQFSKDLRHLRLGSIKSYVTYGSDVLQSAFRVLRNLHTLSFSTCLPVDDFLEAIGRSCWCLQCLDLGLSRFGGRGPGLTERSMRRLCFADWQNEQYPGPTQRNPCCDTLRMVSLGREGFFQMNRGNVPPSSAVALLLRMVPNLQSIPGYPRTGEAFVVIMSEDTHPAQTKLETVWDYKTDRVKLAAINRLAPELTDLVLRNPKEGVCEELHLFQKVTRLMLTDLERWATLSVLLQLRGEHLTSLQVYNSRTLIDLTQVSILCPNLARLVCDNVHVQCQHLQESPSPGRILESMQDLGLSGDLGPGSDNVVSSFLPICPNLQHFSWRQRFLKESAIMSDLNLENLLKRTGGSFSSLESIWLATDCRLTITSVLLLVNSCPNIRIIGSMRFWKISPEEVTNLRAELRSSNMDVELWGDEEIEDVSRQNELARVLVYPGWLLPL